MATSPSPLRYLAVALTLLGAFAAQPSAHADTILFDPDGAAVANSAIAFETIDLLPGNGLFRGIGAIDSSMTNQAFTGYMQARVGNFYDNLSALIPVAGLNSTFEITAVFSFSGVATGDGVSTDYSLAGSPSVNSFSLFYDSTPDASNLAGTGFDDGTLILSGSFNSADGTFTIVPSGPLPKLDLNGTDNYPGTTTLKTVGGADYEVGGLTGDNSFFVSNVSTLQFLQANSSTITPFVQIDPSAVFQPNYANYTPSLGPVNGQGSDFQYQADVNGSFTVPEPSAVLLLLQGFGGAGALAWAAARRRGR